MRMMKTSHLRVNQTMKWRIEAGFSTQNEMISGKRENQGRGGAHPRSRPRSRIEPAIEKHTSLVLVSCAEILIY